jgi:Glycosyl hydrolase family 26
MQFSARTLRTKAKAKCAFRFFSNSTRYNRNLCAMHHCAGSWYVWGTYASAANTKSEFIRAWIHIVTLFRSSNTPVKFQLAYNCAMVFGDPTPFSAWYPGSQYVDMLMCDGESLLCCVRASHALNCSALTACWIYIVLVASVVVLAQAAPSRSMQHGYKRYTVC